MDLTDYRREMDAADEQLLAAFEKRMEIAQRIAEYKRDNALPVLDAKREQQKLRAVAEKVPEELSEYAVTLYSAAAARRALSEQKARFLRR